MYWNLNVELDINNQNKLNINIRCIEISVSQKNRGMLLHWILTLDVLKCAALVPDVLLYELNINIRCIEIGKYMAWARQAEIEY